MSAINVCINTTTSKFNCITVLVYVCLSTVMHVDILQSKCTLHISPRIRLYSELWYTDWHFEPIMWKKCSETVKSGCNLTHQYIKVYYTAWFLGYFHLVTLVCKPLCVKCVCMCSCCNVYVAGMSNGDGKLGVNGSKIETPNVRKRHKRAKSGGMRNMDAGGGDGILNLLVAFNSKNKNNANMSTGNISTFIMLNGGGYFTNCQSVGKSQYCQDWTKRYYWLQLGSAEFIVVWSKYLSNLINNIQIKHISKCFRFWWLWVRDS